MNLGLKERSLGAFLSSLQHPNVQRIYSIKHKVSQGNEEEGGRSMDFVVVTQPVFGVSLRDVIRGEVSNGVQEVEICDCNRENRPVSEKINYRVNAEIVVQA